MEGGAAELETTARAAVAAVVRTTRTRQEGVAATEGQQGGAEVEGRAAGGVGEREECIPLVQVYVAKLT